MYSTYLGKGQGRGEGRVVGNCVLRIADGPITTLPISGITAWERDALSNDRCLQHMAQSTRRKDWGNSQSHWDAAYKQSLVSSRVSYKT
jgi:hypothetical protein